MSNNAEIGLRIKEARKAAKLTQTALAWMINKTLRTVQKYESGEIEPSLVVIEEIAKVLGVPTGDLIGCKINLSEYNSIEDGPPPLPGRYLCIRKGLDHPDGQEDVLYFNGEYFPWERVYSSGRVVVTHWMRLPARPMKEKFILEVQHEND